MFLSILYISQAPFKEFLIFLKKIAMYVWKTLDEN